MQFLSNGFMLVALAGALGVVFTKNPVHSVLSLIVTFIATACIWLLLEAEFLAIILVLVYVGAVMVLFLFVVMMLDVEFAALKAKITRSMLLGISLATIFFLILFSTLYNDQSLIEHVAEVETYYGISNIKILAQIIFTRFILHFEIAGVLLLVAMIAAIALIYQGPRNRRMQNIKQQISTDPKSRIKLVEGN